MLPEEQDSLVKSWLTIQRHWWAYDSLDVMCRDNPEEAWPIVVALVNAAETDELLANVGAGPLEDLLTSHGPMLIERVEALASSSPQFQKALSNVWLSGQESELNRRLLALGCQFVGAKK